MIKNLSRNSQVFISFKLFEKTLKTSTLVHMHHTRAQMLIFGDILAFVGGFFLFIVTTYGLSRFSYGIEINTLPFIPLVIIWMIIFYIFNFYNLQQSKPTILYVRNLIIAGCICLAIGFIYFYINPLTRITPKSNLIIFELYSLLLVFGIRRLFYMATREAFHTRFAIVCSEESFHPLVTEINHHPHLGFKNSGTFSTLATYQQSQPDINLLIVHNISPDEYPLLEQALKSQVEVIDLATAYEMILYKIPVDFIDNQWIISSITKSSQQAYRLLSRTIAILFALGVGMVTLPISLVIILAIKLEDGGPIFIKQARTGLHGKIFKLYKFRSMIVVGADGQAESNGAVWASADHDPRITRVGTITRKLHIDEIPQLFNILKGDLTLVGPRPERPEFVAQLEHDIPYYFMRHTIMPGFTGWAQIKFRYARSVMDSREKFEYDLFYIKNRNIFLDIGIILKTAQIIFTHAGK